MIRMFTVFTEEADDPELAAASVMRALKGFSLSRRSVGVLHCHPDFLDTGAVAEICSALPFDVVGGTAAAASVNGVSGKRILTLAVLSSDGDEFVTGVSPEVSSCASGPVNELYGVLRRPSPPAVILAFVPVMRNVGGDEFIEALDAASGGVPVFGTLPSSNEPDLAHSFTICNGKRYDRSMTALAIYGDVRPDFLIASMEYKNVLKQKAIVTSSNRNIVHAVNGMPAAEFFESVGLVTGGDFRILTTIPMVFRSQDRPELIRDCAGVTADGGLVMLGSVQEGSSMRLAMPDPDGMVCAAIDTVREACAVSGGRGMLMYACVWRFWMLGRDGMSEHNGTRELVGGSPPFMLAQSGGELFPARVGDGIVNSLQNNSFIICLL